MDHGDEIIPHTLSAARQCLRSTAVYIQICFSRGLVNLCSLAVGELIIHMRNNSVKLYKSTVLYCMIFYTQLALFGSQFERFFFFANRFADLVLITINTSTKSSIKKIVDVWIT
jgi:hypothetical protein